MDSTQNIGEPDAKPVPSKSVDEQNSPETARLKDEIIREILADPRITQSLKDKALSEMRKDRGIKPFKDVFDEIRIMRDSGMTDREIEQAGRIKDLEESLGLSMPQNTPGRSVQEQQPDAVKLTVEALGLDYNDAEVYQALASQNQQDVIKSLHNLASRQQRSVNPALVTQSAGGGVSQSDALMQEYKARAKTSFGMDLINLKQEFQKRGLEIY